METTNLIKMKERNTKFPEFSFEDQVIAPYHKARVSLMIKKDIMYKRMNQYEDVENPMLTILIKEKKGKHLAISAIYRQWKAPGELLPNNTEGISRQCWRLNMVIEKWTEISQDEHELSIAGDIIIN